jgi:hypothetical protein
MTNIVPGDRTEVWLLANDADDMLDMYEAARRVGDAEIESWPRSDDPGVDAAVRTYYDFAVALNRCHPDNGLGSADELAALVRRKVAAGGYVARLTVYASAGQRPASENVSLFRTALGGLRRAHNMDMALGEAS